MSERRITAAKPERVRRDVAGFGPVSTTDASSTPQDPSAADAPIVRVVLVPAVGEPEGERARSDTGDPPPTDWREW